ncbi:kanamycin kinase [Goodfellowiella coeruleoviolacea]|uniref:Kanamycin kinase n=1 Tax=Goodfellowiella coeruleoviolacea TaxID=334858 RepID=A0AAE3GLL7_9PSEU|nr:kanamycin kinase [Goodfellowiella coeruleoviolacea]
MDDVRNVLATLKRRHHRQDWHPITHGHSGAGVWRLGGDPGHYVKIAPRSVSPDSGFDLVAEADRTVWLGGQGIPTAEVVEVGADDTAAWLVTTAVPGRSAAEPWPAEQRADVVDALADIARALHALPVADCPFDRGLAVTVPHARQAAAAGLVDLADLDVERQGWSVSRLLAELDATRPAVEEPVVCHGDLCLPNVLLDPDTRAVTGVIDLGRLGTADRYADLALATRSLSAESLNPQFGPAFAARFLARYGESRVDARRLEFYRLLDEFC